MTNDIEACNSRRLRKVEEGPIIFVTSFCYFARPSVCMYQSGFRWTDIREILWKCVKKIQMLLK